MPDTTYLIAAVLLAASTTFALRTLSFAVIEPLRSSPLAAELALRGSNALLSIFTGTAVYVLALNLP